MPAILSPIIVEPAWLLYVNVVLQGDGMRAILTIAAVGLALAGCQTTEQSFASAESVCLQAGLRPGTTAYGRCTNAAYQQNVANSNAAANAVAVGAAAGGR